MREAIALSRQCPVSDTAFAVGAVIVAADGTRLAGGYSRQNGPQQHAEQAALAQLNAPAAGATAYTSLEPCGRRLSEPTPCARLLIAAGITRVVYALTEPAVFVEGGGARLLSAAGVEVVRYPELAGQVAAINAHVLG